MSRFRKLSHSILHCQHHIVWVPKYSNRVLIEKLKEEVTSCIRAFRATKIVELNVQVDHVHSLVMMPQKIAVSNYIGTVKGRAAIRVLNSNRELKIRPY